MGRSKKVDKLSKRYVKRSMVDAGNAVRIIVESLDRTARVAQLRPETMQSIGARFKENGTDARVISGPVTEARSIETSNLNAFRFKDAEGNKLVISNLGEVSDDQLNLIDTIKALIAKSDFKGAEDIQVFMAVENAAEATRLEELISSADEGLMKKMKFVTRQDDISGGASAASASAAAAAAGVEKGPAPLTNNLITPKRLELLMGDSPKTTPWKSRKYKAVLDKLERYHANIAEYEKRLLSEGDDMLLFAEFQGKMNDIVKELGDAIRAYDSSSTRNIANTTKEEKQEKKNVMYSLLLQLNNVTKVMGDFNINTDLQRVRQENWIREYGPLSDYEIDYDAREIVLGEGAQGEVKTVTYRRIPPFVAGIKIDDTKKSNKPSQDSGIPEDNHEQSKRAVSAYILNDILDMQVIPDTRFIVRNNPSSGVVEFGQAIEYVTGTSGQLEVPSDTAVDAPTQSNLEASQRVVGRGEPTLKNTDEAELAAKKAQYLMEKEALRGFDLRDGKYYKKINKPVVVPPAQHGVVQKGLADLQLLDNIIGHADRHGENFILQTNGIDNTIVGVKGIDNDDTFGSEWKKLNTASGATDTSKTPGLPPVIDLATALRITRANPDTIIKLMETRLAKTLSDKDRAKAIERYQTSVAELTAKLRSGEIKLATEQPMTDALIRDAVRLTGTLDQARRTKRWGETDTADLHNEGNSYYGFMMDTGRKRGFVPPVFNQGRT